MNNNEFDSRFVTDPFKRKLFLDTFMSFMTTKDLQDIFKAAEKLEIEDFKTRPAVDVLYDIACKLCVFEKEIVTPNKIMDKIHEYLTSQ